jgi:hypothetical protein
MIERRIAAGDLTGAVTVVARRGQVAHVESTASWIATRASRCARIRCSASPR